MIAALALACACDSGKPKAKASPAKLAPAAKPTAGGAVRTPQGTRVSVAAPPASAASAPTKAASSGPAAKAASATPAVPKGPYVVGEGTGLAIEEMFPDRLVEAQPSPLSEERRRLVLSEVRRRRTANATLQRILATPDREGAQEVFALYEYKLYAGCTGEAPAAGCPSPEEVALNPGCRAFGIVYAYFVAGTHPDAQRLVVRLMPLSQAACDLQVRHWFAARMDGNPQLDAYLEIVSAQVASKTADKRPQVTTEHRQLLYVWSGEAEDDTDAEPSFFLELGTWTVERWRQREPQVRESIVLYKGLTGHGSFDFIHLLPCIDPSSDDACDPKLRRRKVHSWGESGSSD